MSNIGNRMGIIAGLNWMFWIIIGMSMLFSGDNFGIIYLLASQPSGYIFCYWALVERKQSL